MKLTDLRNPLKIRAILLKDGRFIERDPNDQGFQEWPGSWELWQMVDGRLVRVQRWLKKSVIAEYA